MIKSSGDQNSIHLSNHEKKIYGLYVFVLIISFLPFKMFAYSLPAIITFYYFYKNTLDKNTYQKTITIFLLACLTGLFYTVIYKDFLWINYLLAMITYSSFIILFYKYRINISEGLVKRILSVSWKFILFQCFFGLVQLLYNMFESGIFEGSIGDYVQGTLALGLKGGGNLNNLIFAIVTSAYAVIFFASQNFLTTKRKFKAKIIFIVVMFILASVLHAILFLSLAIVISYFLLPYKYRSRVMKLSNIKIKFSLFKIVGIVVVLFGLLYVSQPENFKKFTYYAGKLSAVREVNPAIVSLKTIAYYNTIFVLNTIEPAQPYVGLGLGQYSSRASLIMSGYYVNLPLLAPKSRKIAKEFIIDPYVMYFIDTNPFAGASTMFPFSSWISLYGELGLPGVIFVLYLIYSLVKKTRKKIKGSLYPSFSLLYLVIIFYVFLLGFQENYWEFAQILSPVFLLVNLLWNYDMQYRATAELVNNKI